MPAAGARCGGVSTSRGRTSAVVRGEMPGREVIGMVGKTRDRIVVESEKVGQPAREGDILEAIVAPYGTHYRVPWDDGPGGGPGGGSTIASNRDGRSAVGRQPVPAGALLSGPGRRRLFGYRADDGPVTYPTTSDPLGSGIVATSRVAAGICSNEISRAGKRDRGRR